VLTLFKREKAPQTLKKEEISLAEIESTGLAITSVYFMKRVGASFQVYPKLTQEMAVFRKIARSDQTEFLWRTL
jgi:hypothetical protein